MPLMKCEGFVIFGSTGCTCCSSDNFVEGIFHTLEEASRRVHSHTKNCTVASQFSKTGRYTIQKISYEKILHDGRIIIGNNVFDEEEFWMTGDDFYFDGDYVKPIPEEDLP